MPAEARRARRPSRVSGQRRADCDPDSESDECHERRSSNLTWSSAEATSCTASGAWSGSRPTSGSASTGSLTNANNSFTLTCTGPADRPAHPPVSRVQGGTNQTGLDFQGSAATTGTVRFRFTNPLAIYPATYIWRVKPRQQSGYYTAFFWGNDGTFFWDDGSPNSYYGAHPVSVAAAEWHAQAGKSRPAVATISATRAWSSTAGTRRRCAYGPMARASITSSTGICRTPVRVISVDSAVDVR